MISHLTLENFKAFQSEQIPLRPLTVLIGENNAGKSSVLAAIRLLAQTSQLSDPSVPLLFDGQFGDFGSFADAVYANHRGKPMGIGITVPYAARRKTSAEHQYKEVRLEAEFKYRTQRRETILRSAKIFADKLSLLAVAFAPDSDRVMVQSVAGAVIPPYLKAELGKALRINNFIPTLAPHLITNRQASTSNPNAAKVYERIAGMENVFSNASMSLALQLYNVEAIGSMRDAPIRTYLHSGSVSESIGLSGENWGSLFVLAESDRSADSNMMHWVREWMRLAGVAENLEIKWLSDRHFEVMVEHPVSGEKENISDVGRGTSQVLPVIMGGYRLRAGQTYLVEEPEIHLHPRAQAALGDYFLDLTHRGVQTILETHSEYLILRLQQHVAAGVLDPANIVFYYVAATASGKTITPLTLNDSAVFETQIPGGFFPQRMEEASKLARARANIGTK
jgi:hypothetical protein